MKKPIEIQGNETHQVTKVDGALEGEYKGVLFKIYRNEKETRWQGHAFTDSGESTTASKDFKSTMIAIEDIIKRDIARLAAKKAS